MSTNGSQAAPSRDEVMRLSTYYAAVESNFDTSEAAQKAGLLTISVMDMAPYEALPAEATHRFYVMINRTSSMVTRYADNRYEVTPHDQTEDQRQERELREAVLDAALWHLTGEGIGYHIGAGPEARAAAIKELLEEGPEGEEEQREEGDPVNHSVVRDELPDLSISLAEGPEGGPAPHILRQWSVQIGGPWNYCEIGLIGYNEDGTPEFITMDREPGDDDDEGDEEE